MNTDVDVGLLGREAVRLFSQEIRERWARAENVWRPAWALDKILDYFRVRGIDGSFLASDVQNALNPMHQGNWWGDFGWVGLNRCDCNRSAK